MTDLCEAHNFAEILVQAGRLYGKRLSANKILAGRDISGEGIEPFYRMGQEAGIDLKLHEQPLKSIDQSYLPLLLILKNQTCILLREIDSQANKYVVIDAAGHISHLDHSRLNSEYSGQVFLMHAPQHSPLKSVLTDQKKHWFWDSLKFSRSLYIDVFVAAFLVNIFALLTPLFVRNVYNRVIPNSAFDTLWVLASGMILVYLFDLLFRFLRTYLLEEAGKKSDIIISSVLYEHVLNMRLSHKFKSTGAFASNIKEFDTLRNFLSSATLTLLIDLPFAFLFLIVIYYFGGNIVLIPLLAGAIIVGYGLLIARPLKKHIDHISKLGSWKNGILIESLGAIETVKSFGLHSAMQLKWDEAVADIAEMNMRSKMLTTSMSTVTNFMVQVSNLLVIISGVYAIHERVLSMGGLIAITMLTSRVLSPLVQVSSLIVNYAYAKSSYDILNHISALPVEENPEKNYLYRDTIKGKIELRDVVFSYPDSREKALDHINVTLEPGETVIVLGDNGSGKSTLLKLIMGLYQPTEGSVLIDGIDLQHLDPAMTRARMNYVPQASILFNASLRENLLYAASDANDEEIIEAIELSGLDPFLHAHPLGYDLPVGERGAELSGGQQQMVALARMFLRRQAPIVLLDEPTDSLDLKTQQHVQSNLSTFLKEKTALIVTHRQHLISLADRVLVLHNAKLVFDGSKEDFFQRFGGTE